MQTIKAILFAIILICWVYLFYIVINDLWKDFFRRKKSHHNERK